jgi:hypothetical protein
VLAAGGCSFDTDNWQLGRATHRSTPGSAAALGDGARGDLT